MLPKVFIKIFGWQVELALLLVLVGLPAKDAHHLHVLSSILLAVVNSLLVPRRLMDQCLTVLVHRTW